MFITGKERKVAKRGAKREEKPTEHEDSSSDESVPDDGELSDEDSDFDPDEDPDRPWCICRKPHGNRYSITIVMMSPLYPCGNAFSTGTHNELVTKLSNFLHSSIKL